MLETKVGVVFVVGFTVIGFSLSLAVDGSRTGAGVGSRLNISWGIVITLSLSSLGVLLGCCGWFTVILLTGSSNTNGMYPS